MATEVVDAFTAATVTAFQELAGTEVALREPTAAGAVSPSADICAAIELRRPIPGRLICAFPSATLETLVRRHLPSGQPVTPDILDDAAGEFTNVIAGQAKTMLKGTPYHYALSTPTVTHGASLARRDSICGAELQFECDAGRFCVWIDVTAESPG